MSITAQTIIDALGGNHAGMCQCPAHDDTTASLKVSTGNNGKILVHCHAGCAPDIVIRALKHRGLWPKSKSPPPRPANDDYMSDAQKDAQRFRDGYKILYATVHAKQKGAIADYFKGRGIDIVPANAMWLPAADASRLTGRQFPAIVMPVVDDGKIVAAQVTFLTKDGKCNLRGKDAKSVRRIFGPSKGGHVQLGESDPGKPLIVSEGIENGLVVSQLTGFPAIASLGTTNMANVVPPKCSEVVIAADNNDVGKTAAKDLRDRLRDMGHVVRIAWPPRKCEDWNDAVRAPKAVHAKLAESIHQTKSFVPELRALTIDEFLKLKFPPKTFLLEPWLETPSLNMIHAQRGCGKTFLGLAIAGALADAMDLLGWTAKRAARVMYVDGEMQGSEMQERIRMLGKPKSDNLTILSRDNLVIHQKEMMIDLATKAGQNKLDELIKKSNSEVIILDNASTLVRSGLENDAEYWQPIQDWLMDHRTHGRTIILIAHEGVQPGRPRGTTKREDVMNTMIGLQQYELDDPAKKESAFELKFTKSRGFVANKSFIIHLSTISGVMVWTVEEMLSLAERIERVKQLKAQGVSQAEIAKKLHRTPAWVSQIVKKMKADEST